jgi:phosphopantothenoylcysteine decarboxylase/phosphopantothenate--cysteine ligase
LLIINGSECEPYLTSDHRVMLEQPEMVYEGIRIELKALGITRCVIGIENNKPDAIEMMRKTKPDDLDATIQPLTVKYPQGAEKMLIKAVMGREVPPGALPSAIGAMVQNVATAANVATLRARGCTLVGPASGEQACGDIGPGRMEEPAVIAAAAAGLFETGLLAGKRVLITAGPTREALDPVRYISNHSSGKMGYALARAAVDAGALTTLVSGPVNLAEPDHVRVLRVESASQMLDQCLQLLPQCDIFIGCAAVADYRPAVIEKRKIKKGPEEISLRLVRNPDIIAAVAASENRPFTVGFAAETNDLLAHAREKMVRKGLDMIVANDVSDSSIGFNSDNNAATVLWADGEQELALAGKAALARQIIELIARRL